MYKQTQAMWKLAKLAETHGAPDELLLDLRTSVLTPYEWWATNKNGLHMAWLLTCKPCTTPDQVPHVHKAMAVFAGYVQLAVSRSMPKAYAAPVRLAATVMQHYAKQWAHGYEATPEELAELETTWYELDQWLYEQYTSQAHVERTFTSTEVYCTLYLDCARRLGDLALRWRRYNSTAILATQSFCFELLAKSLGATMGNSTRANAMLAGAVRLEAPWKTVAQWLDYHSVRLEPDTLLLPVGWQRLPSASLEDAFYQLQAKQRQQVL